MRISNRKARVSTATICAVTAAMLLAASSALGATSVYPNGGSGFNTDAEGWTPGPVSCSPAVLLCTPEAGYDATVGNPPGSIAAKTTVTVNLLNLFKGTEVWDSPQFTVPVGAVTGARLRLDRAFDPGGLVDVEPKATYTVTLRDLTAATSSTPLVETVDKADSTFATRSGAASVVSGHKYQVSIESVTAQSAIAASALSGTTVLRLDNVGLEVQTAGGGSGGGQGGSNGSLTNQQLSRLLQSSLTGPAVLKGNRLFVKAKCPKKVGRACKVSVQGLLKKGRAATSTRTAKVGKGKTKRFVLQVKPKARMKLAKRSKLLFKETVRARGAKATVYKRLKLIRR